MNQMKILIKIFRFLHPKYPCDTCICRAKFTNWKGEEICSVKRWHCNRDNNFNFYKSKDEN